MSDEKNSRIEADWKKREELFSLYLDGDGAAAKALFSSLLKILKGYFAVRIAPAADAEDLAQVTLLKIHFHRDRFDQNQSLKTWIFTIASRSLIDHWRGFKVEMVDLSEDSTPDSAMNDIPADIQSIEQKIQLHRDLNQALATLKPIDRSIVYLYGVEGFSMAEIAKVHASSEGAIKLRAHRAYLELRRILGVMGVLLINLALARWE